MNEWWYTAALGGLFLVVGVVQASFPAQTLNYLDLRRIPVHGVPRTVGGIRVMGILFATSGMGMVILGALDLFDVIDMTPGA